MEGVLGYSQSDMEATVPVDAGDIAGRSAGGAAPHIAQIVAHLDHHGLLRDDGRLCAFDKEARHSLALALMEIDALSEEGKCLLRDFKEYIEITKEINDAEASLIDSLNRQIAENYENTSDELLFCDALIDKLAQQMGMIAIDTTVVPHPAPPPSTLGEPDKKRGKVGRDKVTKIGGKKANFGPKVTETLLRWIASHLNQAMTEDDCAQLMAETGLTRTQIKSWMTNARRRRQSEIKRMAEQMKQETKRRECRTNDEEGFNGSLEDDAKAYRMQRIRAAKTKRNQREPSVDSDESSDESDERGMEWESEEYDRMSAKVQLSFSDDEDEPPRKKQRTPKL